MADGKPEEVIITMADGETEVVTTTTADGEPEDVITTMTDGEPEDVRTTTADGKPEDIITTTEAGEPEDVRTTTANMEPEDDRTTTADGETQDAIVSIIEQKINDFVASDSESCFFRVDDVLRNVNDKDYEPEIVAIGPYHRNKSHLRKMEEHKLRYLKLVLDGRNDQLSLYVTAMRSQEQNARRCYSESTGLSPDDFVEMMVVDGLFIVELIRKFSEVKPLLKENGPNEKKEMDPLFRMERNLCSLQRDLMLFENQLPFFVLSELYKMLDPQGQQSGFIDMAKEFFNDLYPGHGNICTIENSQGNNFKHLLDLIHRNWSTSKLVGSAESEWNMDNIELIESATELSMAGIKFEKLDRVVSFDMEFKHGLLQIPVFTIEDRTECFLRNLIAYEEHCCDARFNIVTDYMTFFGCLIKSVDDVKKLSRRGILRSFVGDNESVCKMFSNMNNSVVGPSRNFHYARLCKEVNSYCNRRWNKLTRILRRKYTHSRWGVISITAASAVLLFGLLQVIFQILSWKHH